MKKSKIFLSISVGLLLTLFVAGAALPARAGPPSAGPSGQTAALSAANPVSPTRPVRLIFIHHSSGENWLADVGEGNDNAGGLGIALRDNNYFVSDTNYGWGPNSPEMGSPIGDHTDIPFWYLWFTGANRSTYLSALYAESNQNSGYSRLPGAAPAGGNQIIMFKSCFPNSYIEGNPDDPPASSADYTSPLDVAHAKRIYLNLLNYFATRQDKLFIVITAPPQVSNETDAAHAANARAFNNWLVGSWLLGYPYRNVAVFDFYNVLTSNGGNTSTNDVGQTNGNHHRWWDGTVQHLQTRNNNLSAYGSNSWDSHPSSAGNQKATAEFIPLLNYAYARWQEGSSSKSVSNSIPEQGATITYTVVIRSAPRLPVTATVYLTDTVMMGLAYVPGTLTATRGTVNAASAPTLRWSGILSPSTAVTVTFAVTVTADQPQVIIGAATIYVPGYQTLTRTATVRANWLPVFLPVTVRN